jgi:hypothetical protein
MKKIKALREAGMRAEHVAFSFMKGSVQPLMARDTPGYQYRATTTRRGCPAKKSTMMILSRVWARYSKICRHTRLV